MPGTRRASGIVLKRTKLGEQDLIVTLLTDGSEQLRAVAKGARKPGAKLSGIMNLANEVDLMLHEGHGLDTITEGKLLVSRAGLANEIERASMAEVVLEVANGLTVEGEHNRLLLPLTSTALDALSEAPTTRLPLIGAAYVLKAASMQGYRPSLDVCVRCGSPMGVDADRERAGFSVAEGGAICSECAGSAGNASEDVLLGWCAALLSMRFDDLVHMEAVEGEADLGSDLLGLCRRWLEVYPGIRTHAIDFVLDLERYL